jgi:hypothetical protein
MRSARSPMRIRRGNIKSKPRSHCRDCRARTRIVELRRAAFRAARLRILIVRGNTIRIV